MLIVPATQLGGGGGPAGILDTYTGATGAWSFRRLRGAYEGYAVRMRRSSDNTEQDFGFGSNGVDFDSSGASSFIGGGTGYIVTWYDQTINGINLITDAYGYQPTYVASGIGSKPCMDFINVTADPVLYNTSTFYETLVTTSAGFIVGVCTFDTGSSQSSKYSDKTLIGDQAGYIAITAQSTPSLTAYNWSTAENYVTQSASTGTDTLITWRHDTGYLYSSKNGATEGWIASGDTQYSGQIQVGQAYGLAWDGKVSELICWDTAHASDHANIEDAINTYYTIYA